MSEPKSVRPPQATVAGWLVVGGSVVVVLMALGQGAVLHSLDTQDAVEEYLSSPPGDQLGLGVQGMLTLLRVVWTVTAVSAAATAILGWYALHRSKGARLALSALAVPLFITSFFFVGLPGASAFPAMVTAAIVMLWFQPSRDWYDGITRVAPAPPPPLPAPPTAPTGRDPLLDLPPPTAPPLHPTPYATQPLQDSPVTGTVNGTVNGAVTTRPASVTWACVLAWLSTSAVFGLLAAGLGWVLVSPEAFLSELHRQNPDLASEGVTDTELRIVAYVGCGLIMAWSAAAATLAVLAWRRIGWAATGLAASAGLASLLCLLSVVGSLVVMLVPLAVCAATVALLLRPESLAWFRTRRRA
jgi:hypothetical protein